MMCIIFFLCGFAIGFIASFFIMRNNPKYFEIDDMLKKQKEEILKAIKEIINK